MMGIKNSTTSISLNQFNGVGKPITVISTANLSETCGNFQVGNSSNNNLSLFIDEDHGWYGTDIRCNITDIKDTRDWIQDGTANDSVINSTLNPGFQVNQDTAGYPYMYAVNGTADKNLDRLTTQHVIKNSSWRAMRLHFSYINAGDDQVVVYDIDYQQLWSSTGSASDVLTPWFEWSQVRVALITDNAQQTDNVYYIDYIEYVPLDGPEYLIQPRIESPHPYPRGGGWIERRYFAIC